MPVDLLFYYIYVNQQQQQLYYNNNNFIICIEYKKLDSLPRKIAGKLVVAGQDKYTNNIY